MSTNFETASAIAERVIKFVSLGAVGFTVVMGLSFRAGAGWGLTIGRRRREGEGKPNLQRLAQAEKSTPFWKDDALIQGGITGLQVMIIYCFYVVAMLAYAAPSPGELPSALCVLMAFPNFMAAFFVVSVSLALRRDARLRPWMIGTCSVAAGVMALFLAVRNQGALSHQIAQFGIFVLQSLLVSYLTGVFNGVGSANLEERFPLVEVTTTNGATIADLRMISSGETECRFVAANGEECLIPKEQIQMVRARPAQPEAMAAVK